MISGPETIVIGRAGDKIDPSFLAKRVFPHPAKGGELRWDYDSMQKEIIEILPGLPYKSNPRTGCMPSSFSKEGGAFCGGIKGECI
jgi:hypothetical protein